MFTRKAAVDKTFIRDSSNICQSSVGIEAGQLTTTQYVKIFQQDCIQDGNLIPISENSRLEIIDVAIFRIWSYLFTKKQDKDAKLKAPGNQKKIDCFNVDSDCDHCKRVFEAMGCLYHFCPYQRSRPSLCDEDIERGNKMCEMDYLRREYIREKGYGRRWEYECWQNLRTNENIKNHIRYKVPLQKTLLYLTFTEKIKSWIPLWLYSAVPDEMKANFASFFFQSSKIQGKVMPLKMIFLSIACEC